MPVLTIRHGTCKVCGEQTTSGDRGPIPVYCDEHVPARYNRKSLRREVAPGPPRTSGHLESKTSDVKLAVTTRKHRVLELRLAGRMLWEIAEELGMPEGSVASILSKELEKLESEIRESAERLRTIEMVRLEKIGEALYQRSVDGELPAVDRFLKVQERRAKLLGLDVEREQSDGGGLNIVVQFPWEAGAGGEVVDSDAVEVDHARRFLPEPGDS